MCLYFTYHVTFSSTIHLKRKTELFTVNKYNRLIDAELVVKLWVNESLVDVRPKVGALVPADVKMIDVHMAQILHHLQLIGHYNSKPKH